MSVALGNNQHIAYVPSKGFVTLYSTDNPSVWYAESRSRPGTSHRIVDVGGPYAHCACPARVRCAHLDAIDLMLAAVAPAAPPRPTPLAIPPGPPSTPRPAPSKENQMSQAESAPTALTVVPHRGEEALAIQLHDPAKQVLIRQLAPDLSPVEFDLFLEVCRNTGLNPIMRQIHAIVRGKGQNRKVTHQVGIDGYRLLAQRTGQFDGVDGPFWCGEDGVWKDVWLSPEPPVAAKGTVFRKDMTRGFTAVARFDEYAQYTAEWANGQSTGRQVLNSMWGKMPAGQIAKCMWSLAYRMAFPAEMSGIYTEDEMGQADNPGRATAENYPFAGGELGPSGDGAQDAHDGEERQWSAANEEQNGPKKWPWMDAYEAARKEAGIRHALIAEFLDARVDQLWFAIDAFVNDGNSPSALIKTTADWVAGGKRRDRVSQSGPAEAEFREMPSVTDAETRELFDTLAPADVSQ